MNTPSCRECGASLRRSKRRFLERFRYVEAYKCQGCGKRYHVTIRSRLYLARFAKCPKCSYRDITPMRRLDRIDRIQTGIFNLFHKLLGGRLYHCWFCRLQFYDLRPRITNSQTGDAWLKGGAKEMFRQT